MFKRKKKLKRISYDTVAYIQIETEAIQDTNDKMMISSYCLHKLEMVEWYLRLLDAGSDKYIVPQSRKELERIREQLIERHEEIMSVKVGKRRNEENSSSPLGIKYPKGYEG